MLKKYYSFLSAILIVVGLCCMFVNTVKGQSKFYTFEVNNKVIQGQLNENPNGYLGILKIPKINLNQGFYEYSSSLNTVDKNIEVIETSAMPDVVTGNLILASHSGNSPIAYFRNLDKLAVGDEISVVYNQKEYKYIISDIYDKEKTGYIEIVRNKNKNTITLITCKRNTNLQTVFIGYMI